MPVLGLGTWESDGVLGRRAVREAVECGYRHIDTAQMYENEEEIGNAVEESDVDRERIFVTTKLARGNLAPDEVHSSCTESLERLRTDYVDLLLVHWPDDSVPLDETFGAMAELRENGRIRHIGVSNFPVEWMERAVETADFPIFCNQIEYHPYIDQKPVLSFCHEHHIAIVAYSPLAQGAVIDDRRLAEIGTRYDKTASQVALRWLVQQPNVAAIPKSTGLDHIEDNLNIFDFELSADDVSLIDSIEKDRRIINPPWAPRWDS
jgi:diketogulonate reductase-like aldo/keto reductase